MSWGITISDVANQTGVTVTAAELAQADGIITIYLNRTPDASAGISARDLSWIGAAIKWQAAWITSQADVTGTAQYDSLTSDGLSVTSTAEWAKVLAPLAARSLKNLTWKGSRTTLVPGTRVQRGAFAYDFSVETSDEVSTWRAL